MDRQFPIEHPGHLPAQARAAVLRSVEAGKPCYPPPITVEEQQGLGELTKGAVFASQLYDIHCCTAYYMAEQWTRTLKGLSSAPDRAAARALEEEYAQRCVATKHEELAAMLALYEHHGYGHIYEGTPMAPVSRTGPA